MSTRADSIPPSRDERFVERSFDIAQFAHLELLTPTPQETLWFFHDLLGMEESARAGQSVYLRGFEDHYHHSLKVTEAPEPGLGHFALRTSSPQALTRCVAALEAAGAGEGWAQEETGHGPAFRFRTPDGHNGELLWEVEYFRAPDGQRSVIHSRPQKRPLRGVPVRSATRRTLRPNWARSSSDVTGEGGRLCPARSAGGWHAAHRRRPAG